MEKIIKVYNRDDYVKLLQGIKVLQVNKLYEVNQEINISPTEDLNISETLCCSFCKTKFDDNTQQRQHYKSDWHRYNLKQNLKKLEPVTEDNFDQLADDVSSISGSDTESDSEREINTNIAVNQGKIYFENEAKNVFCMFKALLHEKKNAPESNDVLIKLARQCIVNNYWIIFMLGGGHFAGGVFNGSDIVAHKTFHFYTCRAKQGGAQNTHEGGSKSAGSNLRRYNEMSMVQRVGEVIQTWLPHIEKSNLIFYRAAGTYNRSILFGGKTPGLKKNDARLRIIPFSTRRPTFTKLQRVHNELSSIKLYDSLESVKAHFATKEKTSPTRSGRLPSPKNKNINRAKSRETKERPLPGTEELSSDESDTERDLETEEQDVSFENLEQYGDDVPEAIKKRKQTKKKKPKKKDRAKKWEETTKKDLLNACSKGDLEMLKNMLEKYKVNEENGEDTTKLLNMVIDEHGNRPLHIAALNNQSDLISWLLENDATPLNKNDKFQSPYTINSDKSIRNVFRTFASEYPDKYNYPKGDIPVQTSSSATAEEIAEKKRAVRKIKKEREKEKQKQNDIKRKIEEERIRFLKLSDREKRALAAERRMLDQNSTVLVRCFLCGLDISGKVPFEYSGNRFCSIDCLKAHRLQNVNIL